MGLDQLPGTGGGRSPSLTGPEEKPDAGGNPLCTHRRGARSGKQRRAIGAQAKPGARSAKERPRRPKAAFPVPVSGRGWG